MAKSKLSKNEELDLMDLVASFWKRKLIICLILLVCVAIALVVESATQKKYESRISISIDNVPPFYEGPRALNDFKKRFFLEKNFNLWKGDVSEVRLKYANFSNKIVVEGVTFSSRGNLIGFEGNEIVARTDDTKLLENLYQYSMFINNNLRETYIVRSKNELAMIEGRFKNLFEGYRSVVDNIFVGNQSVVHSIIEIDRYIRLISGGETVLQLTHPSKPALTSRTLNSLMLISITFGSLLSVVLVFFLDHIRKRDK